MPRLSLANLLLVQKRQGWYQYQQQLCRPISNDILPQISLDWEFSCPFRTYFFRQ